MESLISTLVLIAAGVLAGAVAALGVGGAMHLTARREHGYMHWVIPLMLLVAVLGILLSGRDLTSNFLLPEGAVMPTARPPLIALLQPLTSLLLLAISAERLITHWALRREPSGAPWLLLGFVIFWAGTVASPALLGAHPSLTHDYLYPLVIGLAATQCSRGELDLTLRRARDALLLMMAAGLLLMPLQPRLVMDMAYTQGLLPGLPRFGGLASHAVSMGLLAQLGLLCLMVRPYQRRSLNRVAWLIGLTALVLAQSKTAWLAFVLCSACVLWHRAGASLQQRLGDAQRPASAMALVLAAMGGVVALAIVLMLGDLGVRLDRFLNSAEGAQLASMTGRDQIWALAFDEWTRNPVFGYGPELWGEAFRAAIGMPNATHAHNQFMDTLSRSGVVGAAALALYAVLLLALSLRHARATGGLSLALLVALVMRSISEVPLLLFGYGSELIIHLLLLMTLAAASRQSAPAARAARSAPSHGSDFLAPHAP